MGLAMASAQLIPASRSKIASKRDQSCEVQARLALFQIMPAHDGRQKPQFQITRSLNNGSRKIFAAHDKKDVIAKETSWSSLTEIKKRNERAHFLIIRVKKHTPQDRNIEHKLWGKVQ